MAVVNRAVEDYLAELFVEPADEDLVDITVLVSVGPDVYDSQKMQWSVVKAALAGAAITLDVIPKGDGSSIIDGDWGYTGGAIHPLVTDKDIGIIASKVIKTIYGKQFTIGELPADTSGMYLAADTMFTADDYMSYQNFTSGAVFHNAKGEMVFTVNNGTSIMRLLEDIVQLADGSTTKTVEIGNSPASATGALVYQKGTSNDNTKIVHDWTNLAETILMRLRCDGRLGIGITSMTAVIDIKGGSADEAQFRLRSGTAQTLTDRLNGSWNWNDTDKLLLFYMTDNVAPSVVQLATTPKLSTPAGTTQTINWQDGNSQIIELDSATGDVTLTLTNPVAGASYILKFIQGGTARDVVLPATVLIPGGSAPTTLDITIIDNAEDTLTLWFDGTNYYAQVGENYG